ncbi:MAG: hypothetical protein KIT08_02420 [Anaerolineales bacterium]|nr:MAG: hypothetical protein KIT08_02420 [Anaerolineales bacterium]
MAQAAHSLREIIMPIWRGEESKRTLLKMAGSVTAEDDRIIQEVGRIYGFVTKLAHHEIICSVLEFEQLLLDFEKAMRYALARQLDIHSEIDVVVGQGVSDEEASATKAKELSRLISLNQDARHYFYEKADEAWLDWLHAHGFFAFLSEAAEDPSIYSFITPELHYLTRMAQVDPDKVVGVILDTTISSKTLNPEVVDRFTRIASDLPGDSLVRLVEKIQNEDWPGLMRDFNQWGMDYGKMLGTLQQAGHFKELITLSSAVLSLRSRPEVDPQEYVLRNESPFSIRNHSYTNVFSHLASLPQEFWEEGLSLLLSTLSKIILSVGSEEAQDATFAVGDAFSLYDVDIFSLEVSEQYRDTTSQDIQQLLAAIKALSLKLIAENCADASFVGEFFSKYIESLPDSLVTWRLRLYLLTLCPLVLQRPLKEALFRVFETERYGELTYGAEYKTTLQMVFPSLSDEDKRAYISNLREYFGRPDENEYRKREGSQIASLISEHLTDEEKEVLAGEDFNIDLEVVPRPTVGQMQVGWVRHRGPVDLEQLKEIPLEVIVENLKGEWSPQRLREQDVEQHFLSPLDAEGLGDVLKADISLRPSEYLAHATEFLGDEIDLHYAYSLSAGLEKAIENSTEPFSGEAWGQLFDFCLVIIGVAQAQPIDLHQGEERVGDAHLVRLRGVLHGIASLLQKALSEQALALGLRLEAHRSKVISIIEYILGYPNPVPEDEQIDTAMMTETVGREPPMVSDPLNLAINSIRGKAFRSLVQFVDIERMGFPVEAASKLSSDIKNLCEGVLEEENTRALMFMFGHYLPTFFFLDREWTLERVGRIFPSGRSRRLLFLAGWEGYLYNSLYTEIFNTPQFQKLYKRGVYLADLHYPHQKHFQSPEEGLGAHLAIAYLHELPEDEADILETFWRCGSFEAHRAFVNKIGRLYVSGGNSEIDGLIKNSPELRERIKKIWRRLLENYPKDELFKDFGFWTSLDKGIFQVSELAELLFLTLRRSGGLLEWDIGLMSCLPRLASESPEQTLEAVQLFLLEGSVRVEENRTHFLLDDTWKEVFSLLYNTPSTRAQTVELVDTLIHEGGKFYWPLKESIS